MTLASKHDCVAIDTADSLYRYVQKGRRRNAQGEVASFELLHFPDRLNCHFHHVIEDIGSFEFARNVDGGKMTLVPMPKRDALEALQWWCDWLMGDRLNLQDLCYD